MNDKYRIGVLIVIIGLLYTSCNITKKTRKMDQSETGKSVQSTVTADTVGLLDSLMATKFSQFNTILEGRDAMNVQIIYTQINRGANGAAGLQHHFFNVDKSRYFYPASTVKLPVVLLALQRLNELKDKGINSNTSMLSRTAFSGQTEVFNDPTGAKGRPSIAHYIRKILMVSDNDAYNRLYEFLGQEYINTELHKKGYENVQILHRLNVFLTEDENRQTNPIQFYDSSNNLLYEQKAQRSNLKYALRNDSLGQGFYSGGKLINGRMDFSKKNRLALEDLHSILISVIFPDKVKTSQRFNISEDDRKFVLKYMSQYPTESLYPPYGDEKEMYWPAYCKFLLFGAAKDKLPPNIRLFNKVGDAYGHMIDAAYIVDYKNNIEFFLSAVIYCNSDGILNDDKYDYDSVGKPFMKNLGELIYNYELIRTRNVKPDLKPFLFTYDK